MSKKLVAFIFLFALLFASVHTSYAQTPRPTPTNVSNQATQEEDTNNGSIRGTVYWDQNNNGICQGTGEPVLAGIPIEFVSDDGKTTLYLQSGENGTYGLVAAGYGTWKVSARPDSNYVVTSEPTLEAFVGSNQLLVLNIDFCLRKVGGSGGAPVLLPVSGASSAGLTLFVTLLFFAGFALLSFGLLSYRRQNA
ncbi:MAG TPA: hypothetical protein VLL52_25145 [Anaerolineae bacterium]|nr:hypothetical protein [Anaerolineae bacterium]